jgi:hypothetical protein
MAMDVAPAVARWLRFPLKLLRSFTQTRNLVDRANRILGYQTLRELLAEPRFTDPKRLERHGFKAFSQNDEDGIIDEIFRRICIEQARFVEIGVGDGLENNTVFLLYQGWTGLWIEASQRQYRAIARNLQPAIASRQLRVCHAAATPANVNRLLEDGGAHGVVDLLSIDIDGNDYYVIEAIQTINPRVIVAEYNATMPPPVKWLMKSDDRARAWQGHNYFGASLKSLEGLMTNKGYNLVGCSIIGTNAFFVRSDLTADHFSMPFTAEEHYHPLRLFLSGAFQGGVPPCFGEFEIR